MEVWSEMSYVIRRRQGAAPQQAKMSELESQLEQLGYSDSYFFRATSTLDGYPVCRTHSSVTSFNPAL
jgi:hypothetical protein